MKRILIGHVPVDSATVVICDPAYLGEWQDSDGMQETNDLCERAGAKDLNDMHRFDAPELPFSAAAAWVAHASKNQGAMLGDRRGKNPRFGTAVAAATGLGDGLYPVYVEIIEDRDLSPEDSDIAPVVVGRVARIVVDCGLLEELLEER